NSSVHKVLKYTIYQNNRFKRIYDEAYTFNENGFVTQYIRNTRNKDKMYFTIYENIYKNNKHLSNNYSFIVDGIDNLKFNSMISYYYLSGRELKEIEVDMDVEPIQFVDKDGNEKEYIPPKISVTIEKYDEKSNLIDRISYIGTEDSKTYTRNPREYDENSNLVKGSALEYVERTNSEHLSTTRVLSYEKNNKLSSELIYFDEEIVSKEIYIYKNDLLSKYENHNSGGLSYTKVYEYKDNLISEIETTNHRDNGRRDTYKELFFYDVRNNPKKIMEYREDKLISTQYIEYKYY
ncbi:MAG: hypothetical protein GY756_13240, partial [bacterium]|nr:hypothetical protein [bacterium]